MPAEHDHAHPPPHGHRPSGHGHAGESNHADHAGHSHGHAHAHGHGGHGHAHGAIGVAQAGRAIGISIALNTVFVVIEFVAGLQAQSTALMADAGHNLSDVLGLMLAWGAARLATQSPRGRYTYGLRRTSILAALANAMLLLVACGGIALEAVQRLQSPVPVAGQTVMIVAGVGLVVNGLSAWLLMRGSERDLNMRGAYLHMVADAAVSLGVVLAGGVVMATGWNWLDPAVSLVIVVVILWGTWGLLRASTRLALDAAPEHIAVDAVEAWLRTVPGVSDVHDLHIWAISTTESALTVHLVMPEGHPGDRVIDGVRDALQARFEIHHSTLQVELGQTTHRCCLAPQPAA